MHLLIYYKRHRVTDILVLFSEMRGVFYTAACVYLVLLQNAAQYKETTIHASNLDM